jgi:hypothetical protein
LTCRLSFRGQAIEARENKALNLVLMEVVFHLTANQDPEKIARAAAECYAEASVPNAASALPKWRRRDASGEGGSLSLKQRLQAERPGRGMALQSRHTHFGGVLRVEQGSKEGPKGSKQGAFASNAFQAAAGGDLRQGGPAQRRDRSKIVFNATAPTVKGGGASERLAEKALGEFCLSFLRDSYRPFMHSLKQEFRLETARLQDKDKPCFTRITQFFLAFRRHERALDAPPEPGTKGSTETVDMSLVQVSMDMFSFNLVQKSIDEAVDAKKWRNAEVATELLLEMTHMLW